MELKTRGQTASATPEEVSYTVRRDNEWN